MAKQTFNSTPIRWKTEDLSGTLHKDSLVSFFLGRTPNDWVNVRLHYEEDGTPYLTVYATNSTLRILPRNINQFEIQTEGYPEV